MNRSAEPSGVLERLALRIYTGGGVEAEVEVERVEARAHGQPHRAQAKSDEGGQSERRFASGQAAWRRWRLWRRYEASRAAGTSCFGTDHL
jgi:hypothetical protein